MSCSFSYFFDSCSFPALSTLEENLVVRWKELNLLFLMNLDSLMTDFPTLFREGFWTHAAASGVAGFACSAASAPGQFCSPPS